MEFINMSCFKDLVLIAAGKKPSTPRFLPCMSASHWTRTGHYRYIAGLKFSFESTAVKSADPDNYSKLCCKTKNNAQTHTSIVACCLNLKCIYTSSK